MLSRRGLSISAVALVAGCGLLVSGCAADSSDSVARSAGAPEATNYVGADLVGHDFRGQDLSGADFRGANLRGADFTNANLSGTDFAHLSCALPMNPACSADWGVDAFTAPEAVDQVLGKAGATGLVNGSTPKDVRFNQPGAVAVSPDSSTAYVADVGNRVVRRIDLRSGKVSTFAGSGEKYDSSSGAEANGAGESADHLRLSEPAGLAVAPDGRVFISDAKANVIWAVEPDGSYVNLITGTGRAGTPKQSEGLPLSETRFADPHGLAFNKSGTELYVADTGNNAVRVINFDADNVTTVAGSEDGLQCTWLVTSSCGTTGKAEYALLRAPEAVAVASDGRIAIADTGDDAVRVVDTKGKISTVVAPPKSTPQSDADNYPKPRTVAFTSGGDLFTGPTKVSGGLGRVNAAKASATQDWNDLVSVNTGGSKLIGGVAVNPTSRWAVVADAGSHEVKIVVPQVGANVADATFTGANLGLAGNKPTEIDYWHGQTPLTNVNLSNAIIRNSDLSDTQDSTLEAARISGGHLGNMADVNMYAVSVSGGTNVSGDNLCMAYAYLSPGTYPNWNLTDSTLTHQWQPPGINLGSPLPAAVFTEPEFSNVDISQANAASRLVFDGGYLEDVNFFPNDLRDHQEIKFKGTSLANTPRNSLTAEQDRPDYTKSPKNWNQATTNKACAQAAPSAAGTYYSPTIHWGDKDGQGRSKQNAEFTLVINPNGILTRVGVDSWRNNDDSNPWGCKRNKASTQCRYTITRIRQTDTGESRAELFSTEMIVDQVSKPTRWWDLDDHYAVVLDGMSNADSTGPNPNDLATRVLPGDKFEITTPFGSTTGEFAAAFQTPPAPDTPPAPKVTIDQAGSATLDWNQPVHGGRNGMLVALQVPSFAPIVTDTAYRQITYTVQKSAAADGTYTNAGTCSPAQVLNGRCEISGLGNEPVFLRVQASNSGGSSGYSEPVAIDTKTAWVNQATQKCINSESDLKLRDCNTSSPTQQFSFDSAIGAMVAAADGRCWESARINPTPYVDYPGVVLAKCNGSDAQKWEIRNGTFWNRGKNQCLTDFNLNVSLATCDEKSDMQRFALARASN